MREFSPEAIEQTKAAVRRGERWGVAYAYGKPKQVVEMSGPDGGPIQTQEVREALSKLDTNDLKALIAIYRKAGLKLPGE